jgi:hypothetical protein
MACATTCWAAEMFALEPLPLPAAGEAFDPLELLDDPQAASKIATAAVSAAMATARVTRLGADVNRDMTGLSSSWGCWGG